MLLYSDKLSAQCTAAWNSIHFFQVAYRGTQWGHIVLHSDNSHSGAWRQAQPMEWGT